MTSTTSVPSSVFHQQRREGLLKQRELVQTRLVRLRSEIAKILAKVETGVITGDEAISDAAEKISRMGQVERKMVNDIQRLNEKIGA